MRVLLERIVEELGLEASVAVEEDEEEIHADVEGEDVGLLIGRHGQTIDAVQLLCYQAAFRGRQERKRVIGRRRRLPRRARASRCAAAPTWPPRTRSGTASAVEMDPMGSTERRVVHEHLRERPEVETYSEGDEPNRYVVVAPLSPIERRPGPPPSPALEALLELLASRAPRSPRHERAPRPGRPHRRFAQRARARAACARRGRIADLGSGAGLPGLVLAAVPARARSVDLIESVARKCEFLARGDRADGPRATPRSSASAPRSWAAGEGREAYDAVTARAVGRLATLAELASPLLRGRRGARRLEGGALRGGGGGGGAGGRSAGDGADRDPLGAALRRPAATDTSTCSARMDRPERAAAAARDGGEAAVRVRTRH